MKIGFCWENKKRRTLKSLAFMQLLFVKLSDKVSRSYSTIVARNPYHLMSESKMKMNFVGVELGEIISFVFKKCFCFKKIVDESALCCMLLSICLCDYVSKVNFVFSCLSNLCYITVRIAHHLNSEC